MVNLRLGCDGGIILSGKASAPGQPSATILTKTSRFLPEFGDLNYSCKAENSAYLSDLLPAADTQRQLRYLGRNHGVSDSASGLATSVFIHF